MHEWSFHQSQVAFRECVGDAAPPPRGERYMLWSTSSSLGNALNVFAQTLLYALVSGRALAVGAGLVPALLCDARVGAFACGLPRVPARPPHTTTAARAWQATLRDNATYHESSGYWFAWPGVAAALGRARVASATRDAAATCALRALGCEKRGAHGLDGEACFMMRCTQLLLPRARLRGAFVNATRRTARAAWWGDAAELAAVLGEPAEGDDERGVFYEPHLAGDDLAARFAGALHVRAFPPRLEDGAASPAAQRAFEAFVGEVGDGVVRTAAAAAAPARAAGGAAGLWNCTVGAARRLTRAPGDGAWPRSVLVATDADGLCARLRGAGAAASGVACLQLPPVHLAKLPLAPAPPPRRLAADRESIEAVAAAAAGGALHPMQTPVLDWYSLSRAAAGRG